jgi:hypothetical protein
VCIFAATCSGPNQGLITKLALELKSPDTRSLQGALTKIIHDAANDEDFVDTRIKPQMISTLAQQVDFPPLNSPYEPGNLSLIKVIYFITGKFLVSLPSIS